MNPPFMLSKPEDILNVLYFLSNSPQNAVSTCMANTPMNAEVSDLFGFLPLRACPSEWNRARARGINAPSFPGGHNTESCGKGFQTFKASEPPCGREHRGHREWGMHLSRTDVVCLWAKHMDTKAHCSYLSIPSLSYCPSLVSPVCLIPRIYPKIFSSFCTYYLQVIIHHWVIHHGINNPTHGINRT